MQFKRPRVSPSSALDLVSVDKCGTGRTSKLFQSIIALAQNKPVGSLPTQGREQGFTESYANFQIQRTNRTP